MGQDHIGPTWSRNTFENKKYSVLPWPAHSPDLSPIENLWADLKKRLEAKNGEIRKADLWSVEWELTSKDYCKKLFSSMPERLAAGIKAKGGYTRY